MRLMRMQGWIVMAGSCALLAGCCDDKECRPSADGPQVKDSSPEKTAAETAPSPDLGPDASKVPTGMGEGCSQSADCKHSSLKCLVLSKSKGTGVCTLESCTVDDNKTMINEDTCPTGFRCASITLSGSTTKNYCFELCTPSFTKNPCPASSKTTCSPVSCRYAEPYKAVCFYTACQTGQDCPVYSATTCLINADCAAVASDAFCDDYYCARPGSCTAGGLCGPHKGLGKTTAKVGDPCTSDLDCPENGFCINESTSLSGAIGVSWHNGYCVSRHCAFSKELPEQACPTGSACNILYYGGYCFKSCKIDDTKGCRNHAQDKGGDYECYNWTGWTYKGFKITDSPICINATVETCDSTTCSSIGAPSNTTNMRCRDRYTGASKSSATDPTGICLDDTASGPFDLYPPDAGPAEAGVDAGLADGAASN